MTSTTIRRARTAMQTWQTPLYTRDLPDAERHNAALRELILEAEAKDAQAANFGGIDAIKSSQDILLWQHPSIDWLKAGLVTAVGALTGDVLGEAAREVTQGILAEGWAVVYRSGGSLRPHTHHDSVWSGVYYVSSGSDEEHGDAGYLQLLDPRPAALARQASTGVVRVQPVPGRMVAFPGWLPHQVAATLTGSGLRICVAFNVAYDKNWTGMS